MSELPNCPKCNSSYTYLDDPLYICPECAYEWNPNQIEKEEEDTFKVFDAYGTPLIDGDTVITIKNLPVKGTSRTIKAGTKVKSIRLVDRDHNIDCKIDGFGYMALKSEFVKKG